MNNFIINLFFEEKSFLAYFPALKKNMNMQIKRQKQIFHNIYELSIDFICLLPSTTIIVICLEAIFLQYFFRTWIQHLQHFNVRKISIRTLKQYEMNLLNIAVDKINLHFTINDRLNIVWMIFGELNTSKEFTSENWIYKNTKIWKCANYFWWTNYIKKKI